MPDYSLLDAGRMSADEKRDIQALIAAELGVTAGVDIDSEIDRRIRFMMDYAKATARATLVLGISGGVDSTVAGCLAQRAAKGLRAQGVNVRFIAVRLPYGVQRDESDAQHALRVIGADLALTFDIGPATDATLRSLQQGGLEFRSAGQQDFVMGNVKARQRMIAQYAVAGAYDGLVIGTDHAAEALMGFFTKHGDGAADLTPLAGLTKRQVREMGRVLGVPENLVMKVPTADLESLVPQKPDEDALGVRYVDIDDFLEGKPVSDEAFQVIIRTYLGSAHKRALPASPNPPIDG